MIITLRAHYYHRLVGNGFISLEKLFWFMWVRCVWSADFSLLILKGDWRFKFKFKEFFLMLLTDVFWLTFIKQWKYVKKFWFLNFWWGFFLGFRGLTLLNVENSFFRFFLRIFLIKMLEKIIKLFDWRMLKYFSNDKGGLHCK